jgi:S1-C subfamily serine protease
MAKGAWRRALAWAGLCLGGTLGFTTLGQPAAAAQPEKLLQAPSGGVAPMVVGLTLADNGAGRIQVVSVQPASPAAKARLQPGDRVLAVDGHKPTSAVEVIRKVQASTPGARFKFDVDREGLEGSLWLAPTRQTNGLQDRVVRGSAASERRHEPAALGITMYEGPYTGVRVLTVAQGSPAERAGLLVGDRIVSINGEAIADNGDVTALVGQSHPGATIRIEIDREGLRGVLSPILSSRAAVFRPVAPTIEYRAGSQEPAARYPSLSPAEINDQRSYGG